MKKKNSGRIPSNCTRRLRTIAISDYQESVADGRTDRQTDERTDGQT